jgi:putative aldouronate transport system permease protein
VSNAVRAAGTRVSGRKIKKSAGEVAFNVFNVAFMVIVSALMVMPLLNAYAISFSANAPAARGEVGFWPVGFTVDAYKYLKNFSILATGFKNSAFLLSFGTCVNMFFTILTAYPLSRKTLAGRKFFLAAIVFTMMFSGGLIPMYLLLLKLKLINTTWSLILPGMISAWNLIIMKNFFESIPKELIEAARVDGMSEMRIVVKIIIPLSMSAIATIALFYGVGHWNAYFSAAIYINERSKWPLQLVLREIVVAAQMAQAQTGMDLALNVPVEPLKMAVIVVTTTPILCIYPFIQKYFVKGVIMGAIKG